MKNFIKIFFIVACFFISLFVNSGEESFASLNSDFSQQEAVIMDCVTIPSVPELVLADDINENSIVASNNQRHEISSSSTRKYSYNGGNVEKTSIQNKLLQQIFTSNYNKTFYSTSHKISPLLKNEICTRAP